jgi:hypothetical protein
MRKFGNAVLVNEIDQNPTGRKSRTIAIAFDASKIAEFSEADEKVLEQRARF